MTQETLLVCILCRFSQTEREREGMSGGQLLFNQLHEKLEPLEEIGPINLQPVRCMGACDRSCVVAFTAPNKLTFIPGQTHLIFRKKTHKEFKEIKIVHPLKMTFIYTQTNWEKL
jgi:predicted metal-binding protein